jgi:hypothetical protein
VPASTGARWFLANVHDRALVLSLVPRLTFVGCEHRFPKDLVLACYGFGPPGLEPWNWQGDAAANVAAEAAGIASNAAIASGVAAPTRPVAANTFQPDRRGAGRLADSTVREREEFVAELVRTGVSRGAIHDVFRERFGGCARTIDGYIRAAKESFAVSSLAAVNGPNIAATRSAERARFLDELGRDLEKARASGVWSAVVGLRKLEAEVRGLRVLGETAQQNITTVTNNTVILSPEQRDHRRRLLRRVLAEQESGPAVELEAAGEGVAS